MRGYLSSFEGAFAASDARKLNMLIHYAFHVVGVHKSYVVMTGKCCRCPQFCSCWAVAYEQSVHLKDVVASTSSEKHLSSTVQLLLI